MTIPNGWREVRLGDVCKIHHGFAFKGTTFSEMPTSDILVTPGNFALLGGFQLKKLKYYNGKPIKGYKLNKDDLLVTMTDLSKSSDTLGYSALVPEEIGLTFWHNQRIGRIEILQNNKIDKMFLYWLMRSKSYRDYILATASGTNVKHTSPTTIHNYIVYIPCSIDAQKRIADVLGVLDAKIENNRRMNATLENMAQAIFKAWFIDFYPTKALMAYENGTSPYKTKSELAQSLHMTETQLTHFPNTIDKNTGLPEGWEYKKFENLINKQSVGKKYSSKTALEKGNIPILDQGKSGLIGYHNDNPGFNASIENPIATFANHTCYRRLIYYPFSAIQNVFAYYGKKCIHLVVTLCIITRNRVHRI